VRPLPPALRAYRIGATLLAPGAPALLRWRAGRGKEDPARLGERRGLASHPRPPGEVAWLHGASIGETLALMGLAETLAERGLKVLVTSGTRTSAELLAKRLPPGARHQFVPLDVPRYLRRFLGHWRPAVAIFAESELWPNAVVELAAARTPLVLVNARLSARSSARWAKHAPTTLRALLDRVALVLAQSDADAARFVAAGARAVAATGNLKFDALPPPADPALVEAQAGRLAGRPLWLAASTHPGEEEAVLDAHRALASGFPGLVTAIAPRHPERGPDLEALAIDLGLAADRRGTGASLEAARDVYVADTLGELGLFYRLAPVVFVGGSLVRRGGQNPIEPARLGAALLHGPHTANFADVYQALDEAGGARLVRDAAELADAVGALLVDPASSREMARRAGATVASFTGALARTLAALEPFLPAPTAAADAIW